MEYHYLKKKQIMSQSNIAILIYIAGVIVGALFLDIWGADTNIKKGLAAITWTVLLIIALFYADKKE